jgi:hypothetical protein
MVKACLFVALRRHTGVIRGKSMGSVKAVRRVLDDLLGIL